MKIRLATINAPVFTELGADNHLSPSWREIDTGTFDAHAKDVFEQHIGRIIQVHPDDVDKLKSFEGLELHDGTFRYPGGKGDGKPPIGERHQLAEGAHTASNPEPAPAPRNVVVVADDRAVAEQTKAKRTGAVTPGATVAGAAPKGSDTSRAIEENVTDPNNPTPTKKTR